MNIRFSIFFLLCFHANALTIDGIPFAVRPPSVVDETSRIMVLFGGRNWQGERTIEVFRFHELADKHRLFLLSPSFTQENYWEPSSGSGETLKKAVAQIEKQYGLKPQKLYFYGYSAGGQCAALFQSWMPERVAAWGVHGCGVYPETISSNAAPALITCGLQDAERVPISRHFIYRYREAGGSLLWKPLPSGHELSSDALALAEAWFDAILSDATATVFGEDDTRQIKSSIDIEFRNPLYTERLQKLWLKE